MQIVRLFGKASLLIVLGLAFGCGGDNDDDGLEVLLGDSQTVNGFTAQTSAVRENGRITQVIAEVPFELIQTPPDNGTGPAGAFLSILYPNAVRDATFLNHFEMHWAPEGHPPAIFEVPHFDIHAYAIEEGDVREIAPPDTVTPDANRIPSGYVYPGTDQAVPQMGVHAINPADLQGDFSEVMVLGFWHGSMIFVEPMVTQARLLSKHDITLAIAEPEVLGRATRYPTRFRAVYNALRNTYVFTFDNFVDAAD